MADQDDATTPTDPAPDRVMVPLRVRACALVVFSLGAGVALGRLEVALGLLVFPLLLGVMLAVTLLVAATHAWIAAPVEALAHQLDLMARSEKPQSLKALPTHRRDEVGRIARAVQRIAIRAVRNHHEARSLRQTLGARLEVQENQAMRQLKQMAYRDPLTELGNRRFLDEHLDQLVAIATASRADLLCAVFDVDRFKEVNDRLGHAAGDRLLALVAKLLNASVRKGDVAVRLGGDEFVVLMPGATIGRIENATESVRALLRQQARGEFPGGPAVDLSIGIASLRVDGCESGERLLAVADARLYEAKRQGRGRTVSVGDEPVEPYTGPGAAALPMAG